MLNWESEITNMWQFTGPEPLPFRSISSWTPSAHGVHQAGATAVHRWTFHGAQINQENFFRFMCSYLFFSVTKKRLTSPHLSWLSMPFRCHLFYSDSLIVTLTFVRSGKMYFYEFLVPAVYSSTNSRRMPFIDLLWASTLMFSLVSVTYTSGTTL